MPASILIVVVDGLRASALGGYGNTAFPTPALDQFAAQSLLLDWCYAPSDDLADIYRALWCSEVPREPRDNISRPAGAPLLNSLPKRLADFGYATTLISDDPLVGSFAAAADFDQIAALPAMSSPNESSKRADDPLDTELASHFAVLIQVLKHCVASHPSDPVSAQKPQFVWFHTRGMYGQWDAPIEFQQSLLDEDDPPPIKLVTPPDLIVQTGNDPDAAFRYATAYAAQTMVLDACWEHLLDTLNRDARNPWLVMLIGARGFPLGEHGRIGGIDPRLYAEQLHVPWLIHFPDNLGQLARVGALTSHLDLLPTLIDWSDSDKTLNRPSFGGLSVLPFAKSARTSWREAIIATSATARAIRTPTWCLREDVTPSAMTRHSNDGTPPSELYVRPDDRWEANDVAKLCPAVIDELRAAMSPG
jgi:arylsulfatase A-like enzyme